ncbi:MAG: P-loop NTPase fold protein [Ktedonobacteraceae bacterium]
MKLVFIFDEMDKMDQELQATMVEQLKTLFLTRNAVFLLVTSKEFHYLWLNEQKKEDAVLGSYFSSIILVPLFTAPITKKLLKKLIWIAPDKNGEATLEPDENTFVDTLACYLTYRAKGLPRDIFRLIQEMLEWFPDSLQPFLTNNSKQKIKIDMYAEIERKLESFIGTGIDASSSMLTVAPELFWMDSQRRDHVQRGLYTLIEEVLSHTKLEIIDLNPAGKVPNNI